MRAKRLTIKQRKEIFLALVGLQDMGGISNSEAMSDIEKQFRIDDAQLSQIIDEGIDKDWLDEPAPVM
jgi:DNA-binding MarR family transcriptional regulator